MNIWILILYNFHVYKLRDHQKNIATNLHGWTHSMMRPTPLGWEATPGRHVATWRSGEMPRPTWQENQPSIDISWAFVFSLLACTVHGRIWQTTRVEMSLKTFKKIIGKNREIKLPMNSSGLSPVVLWTCRLLTDFALSLKRCLLYWKTPRPSLKIAFCAQKWKRKMKRRAWYFSFSDLYLLVFKLLFPFLFFRVLVVKLGGLLFKATETSKPSTDT